MGPDASTRFLYVTPTARVLDLRYEGSILSYGDNTELPFPDGEEDL